MTAVEWLEEELKDKLGTIVINKKWELMESLFEQAKAMEKEQITNAFAEGVISAISSTKMNGNEYYNETFKSE